MVLNGALTREALALGFDCIGVTDPAAIGEAGKHFLSFIEAGGHGDMDWLAARPERRGDPRVLRDTNKDPRVHSFFNRTAEVKP